MLRKARNREKRVGIGQIGVVFCTDRSSLLRRWKLKFLKALLRISKN